MTYVIRAQREDDPEWYYVRMQGADTWTLTSIKNHATEWIAKNTARMRLEGAPPQIRHTARIEAA